MSHAKKTIVPMYIVKTADCYQLIVYMSSSVQDIARFLEVPTSEVINKLNSASKIGNYRVGLINLKYTKDELNVFNTLQNETL